MKKEKKEIAIVGLLLSVIMVIVVNLVSYYKKPDGFENVKYGRFLRNTEVADGTILKHSGSFIELTDGRIMKSSVFEDLASLAGKKIYFFGDGMYGIILKGVTYEGVPIESVGHHGTFYVVQTAKKSYHYLLGPVFCIIDKKAYKLPYTSRACYRE